MKTILVTGGVGFIGTNVCQRFLDAGYHVVAFDNLCRKGVEDNLKYLQGYRSPGLFDFVHGDITRPEDYFSLKKYEIVCVGNFAANPGIPKSLEDPLYDFDVNARGTLLLLEMCRTKWGKPVFLQASCYDDQTRALTKEGLKTFDQIKKGDIVFSLNPKTQILEEKKVNNIIIQNYDGNMIQIKGKSTNLLVTPNHRMYIKAPFSSNNKDQKIEVKRADSLLNHTKHTAIFSYPLSFGFNGVKTKPDIFINNLPLQSHKIDRKYKLEDLFYLIGLFIGDGSLERQIKIGKYGSMKSSVIFLHIPEKDRTRKQAENVIKKLGFTPHSATSKLSGNWGIFFSSEEIFELLKQCGTSAHCKIIPEWILSYDSYFLKYLFKGLMGSDGSKDGRNFTTVSYNLSIKFVELCCKLGIQCCHRKSLSKGSVLQSGRTIPPGIRYDIRISCISPNLTIRGKNISEINYKGKIWCLEVENNENFLIERNGQFVFCGNTNKVYSDKINELSLVELGTRYIPRAERGEVYTGNPETFSLDSGGEGNCHSPYGCSKLAADQYVQEYFGAYGVPTVVNRMSCIHGLHQQGCEDQGWSNFFVRQIAAGNGQLNIFGNGKQVRDVLDGRDVAELYYQEFVQIDKCKGKVFNVGGGPNNTLSLLEAIALIEQLSTTITNRGCSATLTFKDWRVGDHKFYCSSIQKVKDVLGWKPQISPEQTLKDMIHEIQNRRD